MVGDKNQKQWIAEAVAHEKAARWSKANAARAAAAACKSERPPSGGGELKPGTVLRHMRWGKVEIECTFVGEGDWRVGGTSHSTLLDATRAAQKALGKKGVDRHAERYWGLDVQEQSDPRGFDQTRVDADLDEDAEIDALEPDFDEAFGAVGAVDDDE